MCISHVFMGSQGDHHISTRLVVGWNYQPRNNEPFAGNHGESNKELMLK